jgi:cytochrome c556
MIIKLWGAMALSASLTVLLAVSGCGDDNPNEIATTSLPNAPGKGGPPPGGAPPSNPKIKAIMSVIGKRPKDLQKTLTNSLKQDAPAWDTIQPQAAEYSKLATELGTLEPTRGDKDSWSKLTLAFAETASELDKAAQAKEKDKAVSAIDELGNSCMSCHRQHRMGPGGGGRGGMGGPGGGGRGGMGGPGRGPGPGGPGGPPPGGPSGSPGGGPPSGEPTTK